MYQGLGCACGGSCGGCGGAKDPAGFGFMETFSGAGEPASSSGLNFSLTDLSNSMAAWDWHQWALAAVAGYVVYRGVAGAIGKTSRAVGSVRSSIRRSSAQRAARSRRIATAKRSYDEAREGSGFLGGLLGA